MIKYQISRWFSGVKISCTGLKESCEKTSKFVKTVLFFNTLIVLLPLSALYIFYEQSIVIGLISYILMGLFTAFFIYLFTPKIEKAKQRSIEDLRLRYAVRRLFQQQRNSLYSALSVLFLVVFSIVGGIQLFILNLIYEAVVSFSIMIILLIIFMPNSPKSRRRDLTEESKSPIISEKNRKIRLKRRYQVLKNKIQITPDRRKKLKAIWMISSCVLFSTILGWTIFFITDEDLKRFQGR